MTTPTTATVLADIRATTTADQAEALARGLMEALA